MKLTDLTAYNHIVIQAHDNPDADAVGSGYALYRYFLSLGREVRLVYGGSSLISKSNLKLMIEELDIPIEHIDSLDCPELLITVDCQYGQGNVTHFDAAQTAVIDHHDTGMASGDFAEIRSRLVSCATLCYSMLKDAGYDINSDVSIATALFYGLYMDSGRLSEINHPLDRDMIDFLHYDKTLITRLKYANFSLSELDTAGYAILHNRYIPEHRFSVVMSKPCDPNILGVISDLVIQVDTIDVCVVYNSHSAGCKLSIRSCTPEISANELASYICDGTGNGGGHLDKAGGFISRTRYEQLFGEKNIEDYIVERFNEYYDNYDIIRYTDDISKPELLRAYIKKPAVYGYVKSCDMFASETDVRIRTLEGDVLVTCRDDIYFMIGSQGEVYPIEKKVFDSKYTPCDGVYEEAFEYPPCVIDTMHAEPHELLSHVHCCLSSSDPVIYARPLAKFAKVFTAWNYDGYMSGRQGDMLCYTEKNSRDVYVVKREIFDDIYTPLNQ